MIGFLLVGAGVSSVVPLVYSATGKSETIVYRGCASSSFNHIGFLGFLLGPPLIGMVASAFNLKVSFSIIAIMGLCLAILATKLKNIR
jgi:MFS family permease